MSYMQLNVMLASFKCYHSRTSIIFKTGYLEKLIMLWHNISLLQHNHRSTGKIQMRQFGLHRIINAMSGKTRAMFQALHINIHNTRIKIREKNENNECI